MRRFSETPTTFLKNEFLETPLNPIIRQATVNENSNKNSLKIALV
jgi:hypothetical protein